MRNLRCLHLIFAAVLLAGATALSAGTLIDVAFTGASATEKTGFAAIGETSHDFWNTCTCNFGSGQGAVPNLAFVDGTASGTSLTAGVPFGASMNGASDPMYGTFVSSCDGCNFTVAVNNLIQGTYDFYIYGHGQTLDFNGIYQLTVGSQSFGTEGTYGPDWQSSVWQEGVQYVVFRNVSLTVGQTVTITVEVSEYGYAAISGLQMAALGPTHYRPSVVNQPSNQTVAAGTDATFSVVGAGTAPLAYQWLYSNGNISDATNSSYTVTNVQPANIGYYSVIVTNAYGNVTSAVAALNVVTPVSQAIDVAFTDAPITSKAGFAATGVSSSDFWNTCTTNGIGDLEFADGTPSGARLNISGVESFDTNGAVDPMFGTYFYTEVPSFSSGILVTITNLPPGGYTFFVYGHGNEDNENSAFEISAGSETYGSQATDGADAAWLSSVWQDGIQYVKLLANASEESQITISVGPGSSPYAFISGIQIVPAPAPYILTEPASQFVAPRAMANFNILTVGAGTIFYQWQFDGSNISGATNSSYTVNNCQPSSQGNYGVVVSNAYGSVTSSLAWLIVNSVVPSFIDVAFTDAAATSKTGFAVTGVTPYDLWNTCSTNGVANLKFVDGAPSGAGLTISGVEAPYENGAADPMFGTYFYTEVPNFSAGIVVTITNLSANLYDFCIYGHGNEDDENSVFQVAVGSQIYGSQATEGGDAAWLSPVWQEGIQYVIFQVNVPEGETVTITAEPGASQYAFISGVQITPATPAPYIITAPTNQQVLQSATKTFSVVAVGTVPLVYQWLLNGMYISGATNSAYSVTDAQLANVGAYTVIVSNEYGSVTSRAAWLTINPSIIDVAYAGGYVFATSKVGFASTGVTSNDFWNTVCFYYGSVPNLSFMDGTPSGATFSMPFAYGNRNSYYNGSPDPMYGSYLPSYFQSFNGTVNNLGAGVYDFYVYGHGNADNQNSVFQIFVGAQSYGSQATIDGPGWLSSVWQEGVQYVEFRNVIVAAGQIVTIMVQPGASGYAEFSGLQIAPVGVATNSPPLIINPSNQFANVNQEIIITNYAYSANEPISFTLGSDAPPGATITSDGIFYWSPSCEQGSTTNLITVWATDRGSPPLSNSMTFSVIVGECVEVSIGSSVVQAGQSTCVPVNLVSTVGLTNLSFSLFYQGGFLTNWNVIPSDSVDLYGAALTVDSFHTQFNFDVLNGQVLQGSTVLGSICLDTLPGASAFVPLTVATISATSPNSSPVTNFISQPGRVVVIGPQSLLDASLGTNSSRILTLYGNPGVSYNLLSSTNLADNSWTTMGSVTLTDLFQTISLGSATNQMQFFKAVQP